MFYFNHDRPGKGVKERDPDQSKVMIFFELLRRKLFSLCKVNIWSLITAIPTFIITFLVLGLFSSQIVDSIALVISENTNASTNDSTAHIFIVDMLLRFVFSFVFALFFGQGPTSAGITYILKSYAKEEHAWFLSGWWQNTKLNFICTILVYSIDLTVVWIIINAINFYMNRSGALSIVAMLIMAVMMIIYMMMHFYIYPLIISFNDSIFTVFIKAFILSIQNAPQNILMLWILIAIHIGIPYLIILAGMGIRVWTGFVLLEILVLPAVTAFMVNFFVYPQIEGCKE